MWSPRAGTPLKGVLGTRPAPTTDVFLNIYRSALGKSWRRGLQCPDWETGDDGDGALMQRAIDLVKTHGGASASLLQRRLRVGYPKAARMIDQMEEMGIIGPPEGAGRMRAVIAR